MRFLVFLGPGMAEINRKTNIYEPLYEDKLYHTPFSMLASEYGKEVIDPKKNGQTLSYFFPAELLPLLARQDLSAPQAASSPAQH